MASHTNIEGKDFFTRAEAAHYACVSLSQFEKYAKSFGIYPFRWMGKHVFRKSDIQEVMEKQWQQFCGEEKIKTSPISIGAKVGNVSASTLEKLRRAKRRQFG